MRRIHRKIPVIPVKHKMLFRMIAVFMTAFVLFLYFDQMLRPVITRMMQYRCRLIAVRIMNEAVLSEMERIGEEEHQLIDIKMSQDGYVTAVEVNSKALNNLKARLTSAVALQLNEVEGQKMSIPVGTLLGWQIFAGRGPELHFKMVPSSFVQSEVRDSLESAGINQTQYTVSVHFTVEMSAMLPGYPSSVTAETDVSVAQVLLAGKVPDFYAVTG